MQSINCVEVGLCNEFSRSRKNAKSKGTSKSFVSFSDSLPLQVPLQRDLPGQVNVIDAASA